MDFLWEICTRDRATSACKQSDCWGANLVALHYGFTAAWHTAHVVRLGSCFLIAAQGWKVVWLLFRGKRDNENQFVHKPAVISRLFTWICDLWGTNIISVLLDLKVAFTRCNLHILILRLNNNLYDKLQVKTEMMTCAISLKFLTWILDKNIRTSWNFAYTLGPNFISFKKSIALSPLPSSRTKSEKKKNGEKGSPRRTKYS